MPVQSIREEVLKAGATYVAVDLHGARVVKNHRPRRVAVVLECNGKVLVVQSNRAYRPDVTRPGPFYSVQPYAAGLLGGPVIQLTPPYIVLGSGIYRIN